MKLHCFYRASHVLVDWVLLTWIWDVPTTLLGQLVATVAAHQPGELPKSRSTQPGSTRTWDALYVVTSTRPVGAKIVPVVFSSRKNPVACTCPV